MFQVNPLLGMHVNIISVLLKVDMNIFSIFQGEAIECEGICVKCDWIYDCIKKKALVPTEKYKVE